MTQFMSLWIKLFFVLTPFFALSMFLTLTDGYSEQRRRKLAVTVTLASAVVCLILFFAGQQLFSLFGITLDSFRVGAGILLMLSGIGLGQGRSGMVGKYEGGDVAVVPMAIPIIVGPATTGTLLVMGAELTTLADKGTGCIALLSAVACIGASLYAGSFLQRFIGERGLSILSRLTGLILTALAAQMIMAGIQGFQERVNVTECGQCHARVEACICAK